VEHVQIAIRQGADYVGIGAIYPTKTKQLTSPIVTVRGIGHMLQALDGTKVKAVAIGMPFLSVPFNEIACTHRWHQIKERPSCFTWRSVINKPCVGWACCGL
jgi:hypothetical protein